MELMYHFRGLMERYSRKRKYLC